MGNYRITGVFYQNTMFFCETDKKKLILVTQIYNTYFSLIIYEIAEKSIKSGLVVIKKIYCPFDLILKRVSLMFCVCIFGKVLKKK